MNEQIIEPILQTNTDLVSLFSKFTTNADYLQYYQTLLLKQHKSLNL